MLDTKGNIALACALSALAGYVDAIGFIYLGGLFVSFMSGNSTRLGVSIAAGQWRDVADAAGIVLLFVSGAAAGSLIALGFKSQRQAAILAAEGTLLALSAASYVYHQPLVAIALIVLAMGMENAVFQNANGGGIGLTYITGALVKVGQMLAVALRGGERWGWLPNLLLWAALVAGSIAGALSYRIFNLHSIAAAAAVALMLSAVVWFTARRRPA